MTATDSPIHVDLDDNVLERLANLICGGEDAVTYRPGYEIVKFFQAAGWRRVGDVEGSRRGWTIEMLKSRRHDPDALRDVLLRLVDPREYIDEDDVREQVLRELNDLLAIEGYHVEYEGSRPQLRQGKPTLQRPAMRTPMELTADLKAVVNDSVFGEQLTGRLTEAQVSWQAGAHTAAVIMLGSVLEGVLYDVAEARKVADEYKVTDHLQKLTDLAGEQGWIAQDVVDYVHVLREHRNLVHPRKQFTKGYDPSDDTVRIAWNVVVAALNDLASR